MNISDRAQEILEKYWVKNKEGNDPWKLDVIQDDPVITELIDTGHAKQEDQILGLTPKGWKEAEGCIRRHRLAECLLSDVLDIRNDNLHELSCKFEHVLQKNVEENICILLGHPDKCPHGKLIPHGECCADNKSKLRKLVMPLSECEVEEKGKIVYLKTHDGYVMNKLTAMGILPGITLQLLRRTPSYLFQMGESQFAIDKGLAQKIMVRPFK